LDADRAPQLKATVGLLPWFCNMKEQSEWRTWNLSGLTVTQLRFDFSFSVHMWSLQRELLVTFGAPFTLHSSTGEAQTFDPELNETLCPLLSLLHRAVAAFSASARGECVLRFDDGLELRGAPHEKYEAWESHGTDELEMASLLCGVGGGSPWG
jgi:hypothetical protein